MANDKRRYIKKLEKERRRKGLPPEGVRQEVPGIDRLVKSYLRRHEDRLRAGANPSEAKRREEYYTSLLLGDNSDEEAAKAREKIERMTNPSSLRTAMGRRSALVENAYAFAVRQQQVMMGVEDDELTEGEERKAVTEEESVERVEALLREEARASRREGHETAGGVKEWRSAEKEAMSEGKKKGDDDKDSLPSILHDRPRAVRALNIWSSRLQSVPYERWTIGAATALDHWIAREVLQMDEPTWRQILEGGGIDAYAGGVDTLPGGETRGGLMDRGRDIVVVRGALFPETLGEGSSGKGAAGDFFMGDAEGESDTRSETEKSIDDLLRTLGNFNDDDEEEEPVWKFDDDDDKEEKNEGQDEEEEEGAGLTTVVDELQKWRERNASSPYEMWDADRKKEFDQWIEKYVAAVYPGADAESVDKDATRASLLSERPADGDRTREFWSKVRTETEADLFLRDCRSEAREKLKSLNKKDALSEEEKATVTELDALLSVPFEVQLEKLAGMATLRPLMDEYASRSDREGFLERYSSILLEGTPVEHLVPDPDGPVGLEDLGPDLREELAEEWSSEDAAGGGAGSGELRFKIIEIPYGTDAYETPRAERARELFQMWNEHRSHRAKFEEALFKRGRLGLEEDGMPRFRRRKDAKKGERKK
ncbi:hypothetical protein ACHAWF_011210 [Thalassiosira exigua]